MTAAAAMHLCYCDLSAVIDSL